MGLDIYFHRFKSESNDISEISNECNKKAQDKLSKFFNRNFKKLSELTFGTPEYTDAWTKFYNGLCKYSQYKWKFEKLKNPVSVEDAEKISKDLIELQYAEADAYFRKVNFIYAFFSERLDDKECCFVEKEDCEKLISLCEEVLKDNGKAGRLLPTRAGFFFGSTEYDEWYFNDCRDCIKKMKKLLKGWKEGERCYVYMSW